MMIAIYNPSYIHSTGHIAHLFFMMTTTTKLLAHSFPVLPRKRDKDPTEAPLPSKLINPQPKPEILQLEKPIYLPNLPFNQTKLKV
jgi:hypothetical protein